MKRSFKIGNLRCVKYIEKKPTQFQPLYLEGQRSNFENGGSGKNECIGGLKEFLQQIFAWGLIMFLVKKGSKIKYGFDGSISNVDLSLFQPNKQLMFSFVTFWFY